MCSWSDGSACHAEFPEPDGQRDITTWHPTRQQTKFLSLVLIFYSSAGMFLFHPISSTLFFFTFLCFVCSLFRFLFYTRFNYFLPCRTLSLLIICRLFNKLQIHQLKLTIIILSINIYPTLCLLDRASS